MLALGGMLLAKPRDALKFSPALGIWFLAELVEFQPNDYDNNKLFYVAWAFLSLAPPPGRCGRLCPGCGPIK